MPVTWSLSQVTEPSQTVVGVEECKRHLRIDGDDEDGLLALYLRAAERAIEADLGISLLSQTWALRLEGFFSERIYLPRPPLISVQSIAYLDGDGATQTLSAALYTVYVHGAGLAVSTPGHVRPAYGESWPVARSQPGSVTISYTAGRTPESAVSDLVRAALLLTVGDLYEHRERSAVEALSELAIYERLVSDHRCYVEPCA